MSDHFKSSNDIIKFKKIIENHQIKELTNSKEIQTPEEMIDDRAQAIARLFVNECNALADDIKGVDPEFDTKNVVDMVHKKFHEILSKHNLTIKEDTTTTFNIGDNVKVGDEQGTIVRMLKDMGNNSIYAYVRFSNRTPVEAELFNVEDLTQV
jgi:hypothetical protein